MHFNQLSYSKELPKLEQLLAKKYSGLGLKRGFCALVEAGYRACSGCILLMKEAS